MEPPGRPWAPDRSPRLLKWYRRRRFITAYRILRNEYERHRQAGHQMQFAAINEAHVDWQCIDCPWYTPWSDE